MSPLAKSTVVEHLQFLGDDKGDKAVCHTLFEHQQPAHTAVPVLKWMNSLKAYMKVKNILIMQ